VWSAVIEAIAIVGFAVLSFVLAIRRSDGWSVTATLLASIVGSGFVVSPGCWRPSPETRHCWLSAK